MGQHDYYPFGGEVPGGTNDGERFKFTGHERDLPGTLDYMHARYYDGMMGRFLSVDPGRDWNLHRPQSWNTYSYVSNDPINTSDPSGKWGWSDVTQWFNARSVDLSEWWSTKWHDAIPAPPDQYAAVEALEAADLSHEDAQQIGNPQARWANARAEAGAILSDQASREIATQVTISTVGSIVVKGLSREVLMMRKALASEAQMAETGEAIAGAGARMPIRDSPRLVSTYGGDVAD